MICVQPDDEIDEGMTIGLLGGSGYGKELAYSAHLHYEIQQKGNAIDPWDGATNRPIDPQTWISQIGPHQNSSSYSEQGGFFGMDLLSRGVSSSTSSNSSSSGSSSNQTGNNKSREPATSVASGLTSLPATTLSNSLPNPGGIAPIPVVPVQPPPGTIIPSAPMFLD